MSQDDEHSPSPNAPQGRDGHWTEESHSFIVRVRITSAPQGTPSRPQFSLEDVTAGETSRHYSLNRLLQQLSARIATIIQPPANRGSLQ